MAGRFCPKCHTEYPPGVFKCPKDNAATEESTIVSGAHPMAGSFIGSYRIKKLIGAGGMGEVLLGEHPTLGTKVAIKILRKEVTSDTDLVARFFAEAKAIAKLKHPNIVEVLDLSVLPDGRAYYVMEHLEGYSLARLLARTQKLSIENAIPIFRELLAALQVAHEGGVIHRDLKPANIFLLKEPTPGGARVKLLDFGVAKLLDRKAGSALSLPGVVLGTPAYMSPEQAMGKVVTAASDLYATGIVLFEALTGGLPFGELEEVGHMEAHVRKTAPKLSSLDPSLASLDSFMARVLEKDPKKRFASAEEMSKALSVLDPTHQSEKASTNKRPAHKTTTQFETAPTNVAIPVQASEPRAVRKQENIEISAKFLAQAEASQSEPARFDPTMRLKKISREEALPTPSQATPKGPLILLGVVGLLAASGLAFLLLKAPEEPARPSVKVLATSEKPSASLVQAPSPAPQAPEPTPTPEPAPEPASKPEPPPAPASAPIEFVKLHFESDPEGALLSVTVDGALAKEQEGPLDITVPKGAAVEVTASLEDHKDAQQTLTAEEDVQLSLSLTPTQKSQPRSTPKKEKKNKPEPTQTPTPTDLPDANDSFDNKKVTPKNPFKVSN